MNDGSPIDPPRPGGYPPGPGAPSPAGDGWRGRRRVVLVLVALLGAIALVAAAVVFNRGDSAEEQVPLGGPATSAALPTASAPTTVDPEAATKAEVIAAYRASWEDQLAVGRDRNATADDDRLRAHLTGDALATVQLALVKRKSRDEVYTGEIKLLNPQVTQLNAETATVRDCIDDATGTVDANTGEVVEPPERVVTSVTVSMKRVGGIWKQANYRDEKVRCTSGAS